MLAPVYRNLDVRNEVFGLAVPMEFGIVMLVAWIAMLGIDSPMAQLLVILGVYAAVRIVNHGRAPGFVQHWAIWQMRRLHAGGRFVAAARAKTPAFPFGPLEYRDVGRGSTGGDR